MTRKIYIRPGSRDIPLAHVQPASTWVKAGPLRRLLKMTAVPTMIAAPSSTGMARKLQPGLTSSTTIGSAPAGRCQCG